MVFIRPESLQFADGRAFDNQLAATVMRQEFEGNFWQVFLEIDGSSRVAKLSMVNDGGSLNHEVGTPVQVWYGAEPAGGLPPGPRAAE